MSLRGLGLLDLRDNGRWDAVAARHFLEAALKEFGRGLARPKGNGCRGAFHFKGDGIDLNIQCELAK